MSAPELPADRLSSIGESLYAGQHSNGGAHPIEYRPPLEVVCGFCGAKVIGSCRSCERIGQREQRGFYY